MKFKIKEVRRTRTKTKRRTRRKTTINRTTNMKKKREVKIKYWSILKLQLDRRERKSWRKGSKQKVKGVEMKTRSKKKNCEKGEKKREKQNTEDTQKKQKS